MSGKGDITTGYRYYMGLHGGICHGPVDALVEIRAADQTLWAGAQTVSGQVQISADNAYGGDTKEGGVSGALDVMMGEPTQMPNSYLQSVIGGIASAYRGLLSVVFEQGHIGSNNPYPKPWTFRVQRALKGWSGPTWYSAKAQIQMISQGGRIQLSKPLQRDLPNAAFLTFGGTIQVQAVGSFATGDTQITVTSSIGITNGMSVTDAIGAIPGGTTCTVIIGNIVNGMNPAHILYEVLTNPDWGMGYPSSVIDTTSFQAAADQLYSEGMGLCLFWKATDTIQNFIQIVLDHIAGTLVQSTTNGTFILTLIRGGYDVSTLPVFTADNVKEMISFEQPSITGCANEMQVKWFDPITKTSQTSTIQSLGAIQSQGMIVSASKDYPGLSNAQLAARVASRDLRATSIPLKRLQVKLDRTAYKLLPGGLFVLNFPAYGVAGVVFRVGEVDFGTLTEGSIKVTALEDVFALPSASYLATPSSAWASTGRTPAAALAVAPYELTWRDLVLGLTQADLNTVPASSGYAGGLAARVNGLQTNWNVWTQTGGVALAKHGQASFCPTGLLAAGISAFEISMTLQSGVDISNVTPPCAALVGSEIVAVTAVDKLGGSVTILRGCVDTVPVAHAPGERVWFFDSFIGCDKVQYVSGESVQIVAQTNATGGQLDMAASPSIVQTIVDRQNMPYPPAMLMINGVRWDQISLIAGPLAVSWRHRNRLTQADQLIDQTAADVSPEVGQTYTVIVKDQTGAIVATQSGITSNTWTAPAIPTSSTSLSVSVFSARGTYTSYQTQTMPLTPRQGWGMNWGSSWGGGASTAIPPQPGGGGGGTGGSGGGSPTTYSLRGYVGLASCPDGFIVTEKIVDTGSQAFRLLSAAPSSSTLAEVERHMLHELHYPQHYFGQSSPSAGGMWDAFVLFAPGGNPAGTAGAAALMNNLVSGLDVGLSTCASITSPSSFNNYGTPAAGFFGYGRVPILTARYSGGLRVFAGAGEIYESTDLSSFALLGKISGPGLPPFMPSVGYGDIWSFLNPVLWMGKFGAKWVSLWSGPFAPASPGPYTNGQFICSSSDGLTNWTRATLPDLSNDQFICHIAIGPSKMVCASLNGSYSGGHFIPTQIRVMASTDGVTWTQEYLGALPTGLYAAPLNIGGTAGAYYSYASPWIVPLGSGFAIYFQPAIAGGGGASPMSYNVLTSAGGGSWSTGSTDLFAMHAVASSGSMIYAADSMTASDYAGPGGKQTLKSSTDGIHFTAMTVPSV